MDDSSRATAISGTRARTFDTVPASSLIHCIAHTPALQVRATQLLRSSALVVQYLASCA